MYMTNEEAPEACDTQDFYVDSSNNRHVAIGPHNRKTFATLRELQLPVEDVT